MNKSPMEVMFNRMKELKNTDTPNTFKKKESSHTVKHKKDEKKLKDKNKVMKFVPLMERLFLSGAVESKECVEIDAGGRKVKATKTHWKGGKS